MFNKVKRLFIEEDGQGMVEYGLIIALVALAVIFAITQLGGNLTDIFNKINNTLKGADSIKTGS